MQTVFYGLAIAALAIPGTGFRQAPLSIAPPFELAQAPKTVNTKVSVALPVSAKVWLKAGGTTTGQVNGFDAKQQVLTLGGEAIQLAKISKVAFDRKALAYRSDGTLVIRGEDTAKAKQSTWQNLALSAFQVKSPKLGQAEINLDGVMKPIEVKGIQSVAVKSIYVIDEIQFQPAGKMTIKVTPSDR